MTPFAFQCAGVTLEALPAGALYWPSRRLLAVADLHLEKGSSYAVNALKLLPRHDTRQTLAALSALLTWLFYVAITLGIARAIMLAALAWLQSRTRRATPPTFTPTVRCNLNVTMDGLAFG